MSPPSRTQTQIERANTVSTALHSLLISAMFIDLVFTEITANRADNDTTPLLPPSPSALPKHEDVRPVRRLVAFGCLLVAYLALKAYEISISYSWFIYKKIVDEVSLIAGSLSLIFLIFTTTIKFTFCVSGPVLLFLIVGRILILCPGFDVVILEVLYIKILQLRQLFSHCKCLVAKYFAYIKLQMAKQEIYEARLVAYEAAIQGVNGKWAFWDTRINQAREAAEAGVAVGAEAAEAGVEVGAEAAEAGVAVGANHVDVAGGGIESDVEVYMTAETGVVGSGVESN